MGRFTKYLPIRLIRDEEGAISVEFVLILPLLLSWYVGSFAFFDAFRDYNVATKAGYTIGDILSRQTSIDNDYIDGLEGLLEQLTWADDNIYIRVSSLTFTTDGGYEVDWSRVTADSQVLTTEMVYLFNWDESHLPVMASGESVVLVETFVPYVPAFGVGAAARTWHHVVVTRPRFTSQLDNSDF